MLFSCLQTAERDAGLFYTLLLNGDSQVYHWIQKTHSKLKEKYYHIDSSAIPVSIKISSVMMYILCRTSLKNKHHHQQKLSPSKQCPQKCFFFVFVGPEQMAAGSLRGDKADFWVLCSPVTAPNQSSAVVLSFSGRLGAVTGSYAQLGRSFGAPQCPPHSGTGQPCFSSQPHSKVHNSRSPSSTSAPASGGPCGEVVLWPGCASTKVCTKARAGTRRTPDARNITQKHAELKIISHLLHEQILG